MNDLWKSVLAEIEIEVSKPIFQTFFKNTQLLTFEKGVATLSSTTPINKNYLESRYYAIIKRALDKKTGENVSLIFTSAANGHRHEKKGSPGPLFAKEVLLQNQKIRPTRIRADYTFDTLAVSESNQLAYTAARTVAESPGIKYNPLYLYGTVGVGKTHLMHAVANKIFDEGDTMKVLYLTTEEFTNEVVEAIMEKTTTQLRKKFRNVDLLLLDDVQFLSGKEKVQEELFHTFNTLIDRGSQVIFSSDRLPSEIKKLEPRLASRFEGGLTVDIQAPDFELRTAILLIKSNNKYNLNLSVDMAKLIAERITDTRALEGFLLKLSTVVLATPDQEITKDLINTQLGAPKPKNSFLHPDTIIETICDFYHIRTTQLRGAKRDAFLVHPRHVCMYLLLKEARLTLVEIGNLLGGRDHTTVMHGVNKVENSLSNQDQKINEEIVFIKRKIQEGYVQ